MLSIGGDGEAERSGWVEWSVRVWVASGEVCVWVASGEVCVWLASGEARLVRRT